MLIRSLRFLAAVRDVAACHKGNAAVEFGLIGPVLILLAFGALDYGGAYVEGLRLNGAARAGAQHALRDSQDWQNTSQMEQIALEEYVGHALTAADIAAMSPSATANAFCACTAGVTLACSATCADGSDPGQFVNVTLNHSAPLTLPYPWASGNSVAVGGQATVRVR